MKYVVVDVGCLECSEESKVLGIYDSVEEAKNTHPEATHITNWREVFGQSQEQILEYDESL